MTDIELVIKIPEEDYKFIKDLRFYHSGRRSGRTIERNVINAIKNGKPYEEKPQGEWIPVSKRLPEERTSVLIWCPDRKNMYCAYLEENQWWIFGAYFEKVPLEVIAWMPLPEVYKEEEKIEVEEPIILTDEQITEMWESGYISDKEEYKDGND